MKDEIESEPRRQFLVLLEKITDQLVRLFMRHNVLIPEMEKMIRRRGVRAAVEDPDFAIDGREEKYQQTYSHAAVVTGLTRQEVSQLISSETSPVPLDGGDLHRTIRILTAWRSEDGYQDRSGEPIDLPLRGPAPSLHQLCHKYGRNAPTRAIADALVNNGNAEWIGDSDERRQGKALRFLTSTVTATSTSREGMMLLTQYSSDYMHSLRWRFESRGDSGPRFREAYFNDIDPVHADVAQAALHEEMEIANRRFAERLEPFRNRSSQRGVRLGVGSYSFRDAPMILDATEGDDE